jgi:protein required for attachment to host cells
LQDSANLAVIIKDGKRMKLDDQGGDEAALTFQAAVA